jgi:hypothetical protein
MMHTGSELVGSLEKKSTEESHESGAKEGARQLFWGELARHLSMNE